MAFNKLQERILKLKKKNNICILAHSYVDREICEIADFTGDSFALAKFAAKSDADTVLMCGVRFMAETVKILSPEKKVLLSHKDAGCPMAQQMSKEYIEKIKSENPTFSVVAYINTTASLKTVCDVCVTSSSAVQIVSKMPEKDILFIPDINLGSYVKEQLPEKNIMLLDGGCPVHAKITEDEVLLAKKKHPNALFLVHPECTKDVVKHADFVGSTKDIMDFARDNDNKEFIVGTENTICTHLRIENPDKKFYILSEKLVCDNMRLTTLEDVLACLEGGGEEIFLDDETIKKARKCIDKMLELG